MVTISFHGTHPLAQQGGTGGAKHRDGEGKEKNGSCHEILVFFSHPLSSREGDESKSCAVNKQYKNEKQQLAILIQH
jgi:hypothetical protein